MKNIPPTVRILLLIGALFTIFSAGYLNGYLVGKHQQKQNTEPSVEKKPSIEMKAPEKAEKPEELKQYLSAFLITDENGDFDEKAVREIFNELNYEKMIPHILSINEKAQKLKAEKTYYHIDENDFGLHVQDNEVVPGIKLWGKTYRESRVLHTLRKAVINLIDSGYVNGKEVKNPEDILKDKKAMQELVVKKYEEEYNRIYLSVKDSFNNDQIHPTHMAKPKKAEKPEELKQYLSAFLITDKNGDFDGNAVREIFDELNYEEMIPHILKVHEKAQKLKAEGTSYNIRETDFSLYVRNNEVVSGINLWGNTLNKNRICTTLVKVAKDLINSGYVNGKKVKNPEDILKDTKAMQELVVKKYEKEYNRIYPSVKDSFNTYSPDR